MKRKHETPRRPSLNDVRAFVGSRATKEQKRRIFTWMTTLSLISGQGLWIQRKRRIWANKP